MARPVRARNASSRFAVPAAATIDPVLPGRGFARLGNGTHEFQTADVSGREPPFPLRVSGVGAFPTARRPKTVWAGITDGAAPSNTKRGSVLRSILRRAERFGWQRLGTTKPFLCDLVPAVV